MKHEITPNGAGLCVWAGILMICTWFWGLSGFIAGFGAALIIHGISLGIAMTTAEKKNGGNQEL